MAEYVLRSVETHKLIPNQREYEHRASCRANHIVIQGRCRAYLKIHDPLISLKMLLSEDDRGTWICRYNVSSAENLSYRSSLQRLHIVTEVRCLISSRKE